MGATDVIPFVPAMDVTVEECVELSRQLGRRIWEELGVPVFLYEDSASSPDRANLADVRRGQFEGMAEKLLKPEWAPDFGERKIHPTAGVVAVGARMPLIAYNVNLDRQGHPLLLRGIQVLQGHRRDAGGPEHRPGVHEPGQLRGHPHLLCV